jgi:hypothetical protein
VHVVDPLGELLRERRRVERLMGEVARVEVDAEALAVVDRVERAAGGHEVVGDLGRMDLEREAHALGVEAVVDRVAHRLADEVVPDRPALQPVALEQLAPRTHVAGLGERAVDLEVVAPAGQLEPVEAPLGAAGGELLQRKVGPLAGEQGDGSRHGTRMLGRLGPPSAEGAPGAAQRLALS